MAQPAKAIDFGSVAEALRDAKAVHTVTRTAKGTVLWEEWKQGNKWRRKFGGTMVSSNLRVTADIWSVSGFDGIDRWAARPEVKTAQVGMLVEGERKVDGELETVQSIIDNLSEISMSDPMVERVKKGAFEVVSFVGKSKHDFSKFKIEVTADPETQLPVEQRYYHFTKERTWQLSSKIEFDYPASLDDSLFSPPSNSYVVYHYRKIAEQIERAFAGVGQSQTVKGVTLTFLAALQEEDGAVLVLWKGGAVPPIDSSVAVFDTKGTQHVAGFWYEDDDRTRERNYGIPPKTPAPKIPREQLLYKLRPFGYFKGHPFYCLRFNPGPVKPNLPQTYNIVLPVCEQVEPYIQQPTPQWVKHEASGREVGVASFRITTSPVSQWFFVRDRIDPDHMHRTGAYPATNIGMTKEQIAAYKKAAMERSGIAN